MKKQITTIFALIIISFFLLTTKVSANSINNIDMDVYIEKNGNAKITEVWETTLTQGTEGYRAYKNLKFARITNFSVSDETGRIYKRLSNWKENANFEDKAYKNGLHYVLDGIELCWGISKYGKNTYTLKYDINNFVNQYTDTQGIYFDFINLDQKVSNAKVTIHSDYSFSFDNSKIWGFGYDGTINFEDGKIVMNSSGSLSSSEYMVALIKLEENVFSTNNSLSKSFDNEYDLAISEVNSNNNYEDKLDYKTVFLIIIAIEVLIVFLIITNPLNWIIAYLIVKKKRDKRRLRGNLYFAPKEKKIPSLRSIQYYREIPCNNDLGKTYWILYQYNIVPEKELNKGMIGAILLKWIKEDKILVIKSHKKWFNKNNYSIDLTKNVFCENTFENNLMRILKKASGQNCILETKEFTKWCQKNYNQVDHLFSNLLSDEQNKLETQQLITPKTQTKKRLFGPKTTTTIKVVSPILLRDAINIKGFKKFLLHFSRMPEKQYFEVHIWEEYLIFSQLLGISNKIEKQFCKLYPNFNQISKLNVNITTVEVRHIVDIGYKGLKRARIATMRNSGSSHSYKGSSNYSSSGRGGSSSRSGGSSSGGSSGGGFR